MAAYTEDVREEALVRLMQLYGDSIKRMCCVYLRDLGLAEDAAQDTFIKAYAHIDDVLSGLILKEALTAHERFAVQWYEKCFALVSHGFS